MRSIFAISGGMIVTFFLFVFMASLIVFKPVPPTSMPRVFDSPPLPTTYSEPEKIERAKLPERKKVEPQPQAPAFGFNNLEKNSRGELQIPPGNGALPKDWNIREPGQFNLDTPGIPGPSQSYGDSKAAMPITQLPPQYPRTEAANGVEGWVRLRFVVNARGEPINISVIEGKPSTVFNKAAIAAISKWRYHPALLEGKPVESSIQEVVLQFSLEKN